MLKQPGCGGRNLNYYPQYSGRYAAEQARALLAAIVETSDDAICSVTTDGDILSWNRAAQELFGYTAEEATTRNVAMLALPSDREETASFMTRAVRKETTISSFDTVLVHKDGGAVEVSVSIFPLCTPEGLPAGASVIIRDARRRRESERGARETRTVAFAGCSSALLSLWRSPPRTVLFFR